MKAEELQTYHIGDKFTALNGTIQYYTVKYTGDEDLFAEQEGRFKLVKALERRCQPVITSIADKEVKFCYEQADVWADAHVEPISKDADSAAARDMIAEAKANLKAAIVEAFGVAEAKVTVTIDPAI